MTDAAAQRRLRVLEAVTDSSLLDVELEKLLDVLLHRVRDLFVVDTATVLFVDATGEFLVARASVGLDEEVFQGVRVPIGAGFAGRVAQSRQVVRVEGVDSSTVVNPLLWERGLRVLVGVPMVAQGRLVGVMHVGCVSSRRFADDEVELLRLVADRIAVAAVLSRSRTERAAAAVLAQSLMPSRLPETPGWALAARYVPAETGVGGDWYDVFPLPGGRIGLVIGDVAGKGLSAAIVMGRLRSALRAYALEFEDPAVVLGKLDRKASHFERTAMATVGYAVVDTVNARMDVSLAGHLPPVLAVPGEGARFVDVPVGLPVGYGLAVSGRPGASVDLPEGSVVVCYTDGLVERRDADIDDRLERLRSVVRPGPPETVCARLMAEMVGAEPATDDIALLAVHHTTTRV
jgi:putative methionine-R-sulfoxide reductase with GAF domain